MSSFHLAYTEPAPKAIRQAKRHLGLCSLVTASNHENQEEISRTMGLSDTVKIVLVVAAPVIFFSALFAAGVWYRRGRWRAQRRQSRWNVLDHPEHGASGSCGACQEKTGRAHLGDHTALNNAVMAEQAESNANVHGPNRKESFTQPHFATIATPIRRIFINPSQPDTIQRVNSITSTLLTHADPSSDALPYGGRKSSIGSVLSYNDLNATDQGEVGLSERRPSVLMDPQQGMVSVRRVSAGGEEDVVKIRSASQSAIARRKSTFPQIDFSEPMESIPTPILPGSHPFSSSSSSIATTSHAGPSVPFVLEPPVKPGVRKAHSRPDSITLATSKSQSTQASTSTSTSTSEHTSREPPTSISTKAMKSPISSASSERKQSAGIFQAWRGFPPTAIAVTDTENTEPVQPLSPKSAKVEPSLAQLSNSPAPLPTFEINVAEDSPAGTSGRGIDSLVVAIDNTLQDHLSSTGSPVSPSATSTNSKRLSRITYLSDVVREDEEKRKSLLLSAGNSSIKGSGGTNQGGLSPGPEEKRRSRLSILSIISGNVE